VNRVSWTQGQAERDKPGQGDACLGCFVRIVVTAVVFAGRAVYSFLGMNTFFCKAGDLAVQGF
jgi:hypothetical protein